MTWLTDKCALATTTPNPLLSRGGGFSGARCEYRAPYPPLLFRGGGWGVVAPVSSHRSAWPLYFNANGVKPRATISRYFSAYGIESGVATPHTREERAHSG
jgi:hypothetical protein